MKEPSAQEKVVAKLGPVQAAMQKAQKVHGSQERMRRACLLLLLLTRITHTYHHWQ